MLASSLVFFGYSQFMNVFPFVISEAYGPARAGFLFAINGVLIVLLQIPVSEFLVRRKSQKFFNTALAGGVFLLAVSLLLVSLTYEKGSAFLILAVVIFTFSELIWGPLLDSAVGEVRGALSAVVALGFTGLCWGIAESAGASLGLLLAKNPYVFQMNGMGIELSPFIIGGVGCLAASCLIQISPAFVNHRINEEKAA